MPFSQYSKPALFAQVFEGWSFYGLRKSHSSDFSFVTWGVCTPLTSFDAFVSKPVPKRDVWNTAKAVLVSNRVCWGDAKEDPRETKECILGGNQWKNRREILGIHSRTCVRECSTWTANVGFLCMGASTGKQLHEETVITLINHIPAKWKESCKKWAWTCWFVLIPCWQWWSAPTKKPMCQEWFIAIALLSFWRWCRIAESCNCHSDFL